MRRLLGLLQRAAPPAPRAGKGGGGLAAGALIACAAICARRAGPPTRQALCPRHSAVRHLCRQPHLSLVLPPLVHDRVGIDKLGRHVPVCRSVRWGVEGLVSNVGARYARAGAPGRPGAGPGQRVPQHGSALARARAPPPPGGPAAGPGRRGSRMPMVMGREGYRRRGLSCARGAPCPARWRSAAGSHPPSIAASKGVGGTQSVHARCHSDRSQGHDPWAGC